MRVGTLIVATIYLQLIQNRYMYRLLYPRFGGTSVFRNVGKYL